MRVYYVSSGLQGCYFVRCMLPMHANGWDGDQISIEPHLKDSEGKAWAAQNSDVIVFHRPDDPDKLNLARYLKKHHGKKIVFDNDDTFKDDGGFRFNEYMNEERMKKGLARINDVIDTFIHEVADLVTCSTDFLNAEYRQLHNNVITLPNCVDPFYFDDPLKNETDVLRIGITGSLAITSDFQLVHQIYKHFDGDKRVRFVLLSLPPKGTDEFVRQLYAEEYKLIDQMDVEWHPFVPNHEYLDAVNNLRLDVMLIPRADNYFNRCKSNIKFLEASMFEVPTIAQSFPDGLSPYQVDVDDSINMFLEKDIDGFINRIEWMITHRDEARKMGKRAREYVEVKYDINNNAHKWQNAYNTLYGN